MREKIFGKQKLNTLKRFADILVLVSYTEKFNRLKKRYNIIFSVQLFTTQNISTHYHESCDKELLQNSVFGLRGYQEPLKLNYRPSKIRVCTKGHKTK